MRRRISAAFVVAIVILCAGCGGEGSGSSSGNAATEVDADQAGLKAANDYQEGMGSIGVSKDGSRYKYGEGPYAAQSRAIRNATVHLVNARAALADAKQNDPQAVGAAAEKLDTVGLAAAKANVGGMTAYRRDMILTLDSTKYEVREFAAMFALVPPVGQVAGARQLFRWNQKHEAREMAEQGYSQQVLDDISKRFPSVASADLSG
jgi:hypothetical protein